MEKKADFTPKRPWNHRKLWVGLLFSFVLAATAGTLEYGRNEAHSAGRRPEIVPAISSEVSSSNKKVDETEQYVSLPNKLNILLLGVDERPKEDDPGRSDTLLVMMIDTLTREVAFLSIPRDTRVRVQGLGWDKINHAFMAGGIPLSKQTAENFLGIPIDYYAKVDMESFGRVVAAIGGVTLDVEKRMQYVDTWSHFVIDLKPGLQRLDGMTALQYVRYRDEEGDIGRVHRQQKFIKAALAEMNSMAFLLKMPSIIREVFASLDTNIPMTVMLGIIHQLKNGMPDGFRATMVEGSPYYIDDISYWVPDVMKTSRKLAELQGVPFTGNTQAAALKRRDEYRRNLPAHAQLDDGSYYSRSDKPQVKTEELPEPLSKPLPKPMPSKATVSSTLPGTEAKTVLPAVKTKQQ